MTDQHPERDATPNVQETSQSDEKEPRFEEALRRLEELVRDLESGQLPLEETIEKFEEGQKLLGTCNELLSRAEFKVKEILKRADGTFGSKVLDLEDDADA